MDTLKIGDVARRTGLTVRTLRYYEEIGLLAPAYDERSGHRLYSERELSRLYRVSLLRRLGTPLDRIGEALDGPGDAMASAVRAHLGELDARMASLGRLRERVTAAAEAMDAPEGLSEDRLLDLLSGMTEVDAGLVRRLTLLVYDDIEAAHDYLVTVFGLGPGVLTRDPTGAVVHGEVHVGDGVVWMHPASPAHRLASPASLGASTHCMAVFVDDVDTHHTRAVAAGAEIVSAPRDMPYGVREYDVRDSEGGLWSFMASLPGRETRDE
jgi:DNA-binding transcriptional MerR regulator/uncharacterized glyoxalase superfamily protein PhnB